MPQPPTPKIQVSDLRGIVIDSDELQKGTQIFDQKQISALARAQNQLFAEVRGSRSAPYRVSLTFDPSGAGIKATCTCQAARTRAVCKHAAALVVAWASAPDAFAELSEPPKPTKKAPTRRAVKTSKVSPQSLMEKGVADVLTLLRELSATGLSRATTELTEPIRALGESLRAHKLRRLSARTLELAALLDKTRESAPEPIAFAELLTDMVLTARKLQKHLAGEPLEDRHVEELVGKTWREADRKPIEGLDLCEIAYRTFVTSDDFIIRESRFIDLATGHHYSEKQILPRARAHMSPPKPSYAGDRLPGVSGSVFPGYAPLRLKLNPLGDKTPLDQSALALLVERALPDIASALSALQEHRRDIFAPERMPAAIRVSTLLGNRRRSRALDTAGQAIFLPDKSGAEDRLAAALYEQAEIRALIGDLALDAALPTLFPLAAVIEGPRGLELRGLLDPSSFAETQARRSQSSAAWIEVARDAGLSPATIALAQLREALAEALSAGLSTFGRREGEPLLARLSDLGLDKPAALLERLLAEPEPLERLEDFVKLYQVLGIALVRIAGATEVDRSALVRVPSYASVFVSRPETWLAPDQIAERRKEGAMSRYEATVQLAHHYESLSPRMLSSQIDSLWANGAATPFVVKALAGRRSEAVAAARRALEGEHARMAKVTAIRVLRKAGGLEAEGMVFDLARQSSDVGLRALAAEARDELELARGRGEAVERRRAEARARRNELGQALLSNPYESTRAGAVAALAELGDVAAIPAIRQAFFSDPSATVRRDAATALGMLGDGAMVDILISMLAARKERPADAYLAITALCRLGDVRAEHELCEAFADDFDTKNVCSALFALGPRGLPALLLQIEAKPEIAERWSCASVFEHLPDQLLGEAMVARLEARREDKFFPELGQTYLKLAGVHPHTKRMVAKAILSLMPKSEAPEGK